MFDFSNWVFNSIISSCNCLLQVSLISSRSFSNSLILISNLLTLVSWVVCNSVYLDVIDCILIFNVFISVVIFKILISYSFLIVIICSLIVTFSFLLFVISKFNLCISFLSISCEFVNSVICFLYVSINDKLISILLWYSDIRNS